MESVIQLNSGSLGSLGSLLFALDLFLDSALGWATSILSWSVAGTKRRLGAFLDVAKFGGGLLFLPLDDEVQAAAYAGIPHVATLSYALCT
jgi:hypothetical protein